MTKFTIGQDVNVCYQGIWHTGEILWIGKGFIGCTITPDPEADYGRVSPMLIPRATVCVRDSDIRPAVNGPVT